MRRPSGMAMRGGAGCRRDHVPALLGEWSIGFARSLHGGEAGEAGAGCGGGEGSERVVVLVGRRAAALQRTKEHCRLPRGPRRPLHAPLEHNCAAGAPSFRVQRVYLSQTALLVVPSPCALDSPDPCAWWRKPAIFWFGRCLSRPRSPLARQHSCVACSSSLLSAEVRDRRLLYFSVFLVYCGCAAVPLASWCAGIYIYIYHNWVQDVPGPG